MQKVRYVKFDRKHNENFPWFLHDNEYKIKGRAKIMGDTHEKESL